MDNPVYALLFAEDLLEYVLKKFGITWVDNECGIRRIRDHIDKHQFDPDVGECVNSLIIYYQDTIEENYQNLMAKGITSVHDFRYECAVTIIFYFSATGWDSVKFLKMCASLAGLTQQFFEKNEESQAKRIALASSEILSYIINFFTIQQTIKPGDLWFKLKLTAKTLMRKINLEVSLPDNDEQILSLSTRIGEQSILVA